MGRRGLSRSKAGSGLLSIKSYGARVISVGIDVILWIPEGKISIELIGISEGPGQETSERFDFRTGVTETGATSGGTLVAEEQVSPMEGAKGAINAIGVGLDCCVGSNRPIENPVRKSCHRHHQSSIPYYRIQLLELQH